VSTEHVATKPWNNIFNLDEFFWQFCYSLATKAYLFIVQIIAALPGI